MFHEYLKALAFLGLFVDCVARDDFVKTKFSFKVNTMFMTSIKDFSQSSDCWVNGRRLMCYCGKDPMAIVIIYGHVQGFCQEHFSCINTDIDTQEYPEEVYEGA